MMVKESENPLQREYKELIYSLNEGSHTLTLQVDHLMQELSRKDQYFPTQLE